MGAKEEETALPDGPRRLDYMDDPHAWVQAHLPLLDQWPTHAGAMDICGLRALMEDVADDMLNRVKGNLRQLMAHLMKAALTRNPQAVPNWRTECRTFHQNARDWYKHSVNQKIDMDDLWEDAAKLVKDSFEDHGEPPPILPTTCPFTLCQLLARDLNISGLVEDLRRQHRGVEAG